MKLWLVSQILVTALCLIAADPMAEECAELLKPLSLADKAAMSGEGHLLLGFTKHEAFNAILGATESSWINNTVEDDHVVMRETLKINGSCYRMKVNFTVEDDRVSMTLANMSSTYQLLPSCAGCFTISGNCTSKSFKDIMKMWNLNIEVEDEISTDAIYIYSRETALKDEDRERFMKQARCLGYSGDPNFTYNPDKGFCKEDEGVEMPM